MIRIRRGTYEDLPKIAALLVDTWQSGYRDFLPTTLLDNLTTDQQLKRHQRIFCSGTSYLVATTDSDQIAGFTSFGQVRSEKMLADVELYTLYVAMDHQRRGIGRQLLEAVICEISISYTSLGVIVMAENPYRSFYSKIDLGN